MRPSIEKLRWALAGGSLGLVLILALYVGYGHYKALKLWRERISKLGVHIERTSDNVTYSQTLDGRTIYTLHAAKTIQHENGKVTLRDVILTLYGHGEGRADRIYGNEFEYDDKTGIARAVGEVQMDLGAPPALSKGKKTPVPPGGSAPSENAERNIHVRTSGVVYVRKLGVAATDELVEFSYAGLQCTAKGAEFDTGESIVHLLADVRLNGQIRNRPVVLNAAKADMNRTTDIVTLTNPVFQSRGQTLRAANGVVHLRNDGSVDTAQASGGVSLEQGTRRVAAARMEAVFNTSSQPQRTKLLENVTLDDTDPTRPMHGTAAEADTTFDAAGAPISMVATGNAQLSASVRSKDGHMLARTLHGNRIEAAFQHEHGEKTSSLRTIHAVGGAAASAESPASPTEGIKTTQIAADDLQAAFAPGGGRKPEPQRVVGNGHTRLQQDAPRGEQQISTGDQLDIAFAPADAGGALQVASAAQTGHVTVQSRAAAKGGTAPPPETIFGSADRTTYDGLTAKLALLGNAHFTQGDTTVSAATVAADQRTGDSDANGSVVATFKNAQQPDAPATHVRSDSAHLQHVLEVAEFRGTDARPARLWQEASQIEAASLLMDGKRHTLTARPENSSGVIHAVLAGTGNAAKADDSGSKAKPKPGGIFGPSSGAASQPGGNVARITAGSMDYDDVGRAATFGGHVRMDGSTGQVQGEHATAFLTPLPPGQGPATLGSSQSRSPRPAAASSGQVTPFGGSLQKVVIWGDVKLQQPGRSGKGDRLVYTSADSGYVLTGTPGKAAEVSDAQRGLVTGATLVFHSGDSTIVVSGASPGASQGERGRVRTETGAKH